MPYGLLSVNGSATVNMTGGVYLFHPDRHNPFHVRNDGVNMWVFLIHAGPSESDACGVLTGTAISNPRHEVNSRGDDDAKSAQGYEQPLLSGPLTAELAS